MSKEVDRVLGGRPLGEESPEGTKDHRDFADTVKCPICGEEFTQDSTKPSDTRGDKSGHLKALEHHAEEHPGKKWKGVKTVEKKEKVTEKVEV